jgi:hypothetical protein
LEKKESRAEDLVANLHGATKASYEAMGRRIDGLQDSLSAIELQNREQMTTTNLLSSKVESLANDDKTLHSKLDQLLQLVQSQHTAGSTGMFFCFLTCFLFYYLFLFLFLFLTMVDCRFVFSYCL